MLRNKKTAILLFSLMLLVLLFFTLPLWSSSRLLYQGDIYNSDVTELNFPARYSLSGALKSGGSPFWNQYIGCGFPVLAEGQTGVIYPLNLILFGFLNPVLAFNLSVVLSLLLALIFSYLLFRHYGVSRPSSLFSAIAFTFSGFMVAKLKFTYMINAICWLPLAIYGLEKAFSTKKLKYLLLSTLALAMQLLAGGGQIFLITLSVMLVIFAWRFFSLLLAKNGVDQEGKKRLLIGLLIGFVLCVMLGAAIAAPQLIPQVGAFPDFNRSGDLPFSWSLGTPMQPRNLVQFFSPFRFGNPARGTYDLSYDYFWENIAYPGLLTLVLAIVAILFLSKKDRTIQMWLLIAFLALAVSLGDNTPLAEWLWKYVPGFKMFRFYQRYLIVVVLAMTILGGKALDYLASFFRDSRAWYYSFVFLVFAVLLADLGLFAYNQVSTIEASRLLEPNQTVEWLEEKLGEPDEYRIAVSGEDEAWYEAYTQSHGWLGEKDLYFEYLQLLPPNYNGIFEIPGTGQYGAYGLTPIKEFWIFTNYGRVPGEGWRMTIPDSTINLLAMQSARYLLTPYILDNQGLTLVEEINTDIRGMDYRIYEIEGAMPRAFITRKYEIVEHPDELTVADMVDLFWNSDETRDRVILEQEPMFDYTPGHAGEARISSVEDTKIAIEANTPEGGMLVLNDSFFQDWRVYVDGEEGDILRANLAFMAVELEPGEHRVEFINRTVSIYYGLSIFLAATLLLLLILFQNRRTGWLDLNPGPPK